MENLCTLCPRNCSVDRMIGKTGYCGQTDKIYVARAALHMWEEPCISGEEGSGTVFFCGCPLRCIFCQNHKIALGKEENGEKIGKEISIVRLKEIFLELQTKGANNINLVTGTHYIPQIAKALSLAKAEGLIIPVVYNTSGYERVESLRLLEGLVDIYLPDMKYVSKELSKEYSNAENYFEVASKAIEEMVRQVGEPIFDDRGLIKKGVIVRHLVLPGSTKDSKAVFDYLWNAYGNRIYISIMNQYTPMQQIKNHPLLSRKVTKREYQKVVDYALSLGWENGFIQEGETAKESFIPGFNGVGV
ncbi:MAG: radical SAM protein [Lachnospiraceae bacterium]|nr:radical SAM protein [Lachnospiraceae bacterium]